jgi:2-keto-3-deoxy-6-phosphogluconate aldolase
LRRQHCSTPCRFPGPPRRQKWKPPTAPAPISSRSSPPPTAASTSSAPSAGRCLRLFPTAGVDADNVADYLRAGCAGCGFVRSLFVPEDMIARNFTAIRQRAEQIIKRVTEWRSKK